MRSSLVVLAFVVLSACALRPQYRAYVTDPKGPPVKLIVLERLSDKPLAGTKVEFGELKTKQQLIAAADGTLVLPADKRSFDDNPVLVVTPPEGQDGYRLKLFAEYKRRCGKDTDCAASEICEATVCVAAPPKPVEPAPEAAPAPAAEPAPAAPTP
jgi:hypothetical protein